MKKEDLNDICTLHSKIINIQQIFFFVDDCELCISLIYPGDALSAL